MQFVVRLHSSGSEGQDRAHGFKLSDGYLLVVADGAGGTTHGQEAATAVLDAASLHALKMRPNAW